MYCKSVKLVELFLSLVKLYLEASYGKVEIDFTPNEYSATSHLKLWIQRLLHSMFENYSMILYSLCLSEHNNPVFLVILKRANNFLKKYENWPGGAGVVLQTPLSFIDWLIDLFSLRSFSSRSLKQHYFQTVRATTTSCAVKFSGLV